MAKMEMVASVPNHSVKIEYSGTHEGGRHWAKAIMSL